MGFERFLFEKRISFIVAVMILCVAATMMHPTFASLLALFMIAAFLVVLRWVSIREGMYRARVLDKVVPPPA